jgi:urocanate hydratase
MADMAVQCFAGNAARGMTLCALHNGGGVGIGKSINGGFGLLLDGSARVDEIIKSAMSWDVMGGVARRSWAGNAGAYVTAKRYNERDNNKGHITLPYLASDALLDRLLKDN